LAIQRPDEVSGAQTVALTYDGEVEDLSTVKVGKRKWQSSPKYILDRPLRRYALITTILIFGLVVGLGIGLFSNNTNHAANAVANPVQSTSVPTQNTQEKMPGPEFIYPVDGQTLDYEGAYLFKVTVVSAAQGYRFSFFQNDKMSWENLRDAHTLSGVEYGIGAGTSAHDLFVPGDVQVLVSAQVAGQWTNARTITIHLRPRCQKNASCLTTTPTSALTKA